MRSLCKTVPVRICRSDMRVPPQIYFNGVDSYKATMKGHSLRSVTLPPLMRSLVRLTFPHSDALARILRNSNQAITKHVIDDQLAVFITEPIRNASLPRYVYDELT